MQKIDQLSEQISFLLQVHENSLDECSREFELLMNAVETAIAAKQGDNEASAGAEHVREALAQKIGQMYEEFAEDVEALRGQRDMIEEVRRLPEGKKQEEMIKIVMEDAGELEEIDLFRERVLKDIEEAKKGFIFMLGDIKFALEEGGIEELEALFEAMELDESAAREESEEEDFLDEDGECCGGQRPCTMSCGDCLDDGCEEIADEFRKFSNPYDVKTKKDKKLS